MNSSKPRRLHEDADPPILTGSAPEGTTELFHIEYFDNDAYLTQSNNYTQKLGQWPLVKSLPSTCFPC